MESQERPQEKLTLEQRPRGSLGGGRFKLREGRGELCGEWAGSTGAPARRLRLGGNEQERPEGTGQGKIYGAAS